MGKNIEHDVFPRNNVVLQPCDYVIIQKFSKMCSKKFNKKLIVKIYDAMGQSFKFTNYSRRIIHSGHPPLSVIQVLGGEWTKLRAWHTSCWFGFNQEGAITSLFGEWKTKTALKSPINA